MRARHPQMFALRKTAKTASSNHPVRLFGKARSLSCKELAEKIDTTLISNYVKKKQ